MDKSKKSQDVDLLGLNSPSKDLITKPATENLFDSFNENSIFTNQLKSPVVQSSVTKVYNFYWIIYLQLVFLIVYFILYNWIAKLKLYFDNLFVKKSKLYTE